MGLDVINKFEGEYAFLSNFYHAPMTIGTNTFNTVEHGYQAAKAENEELAQKILNCATPAEAKKLGRKCKLDSNWENEKLGNMIALVLAKFDQHPDLMQKLLDTGEAELIEGNWWGDTYWGVCNGIGQNYLGRLLMSIRDFERQKRAKENYKT
jgi:ribA/ribD-fused uncharacterized protein